MSKARNTSLLKIALTLLGVLALMLIWNYLALNTNYGVNYIEITRLKVVWTGVLVAAIIETKRFLFDLPQ